MGVNFNEPDLANIKSIGTVSNNGDLSLLIKDTSTLELAVDSLDPAVVKEVGPQYAIGGSSHIMPSERSLFHRLIRALAETRHPWQHSPHDKNLMKEKVEHCKAIVVFLMERGYSLNDLALDPNTKSAITMLDELCLPLVRYPAEINELFVWLAAKGALLTGNSLPALFKTIGRPKAQCLTLIHAMLIKRYGSLTKAPTPQEAKNCACYHS